MGTSKVLNRYHSFGDLVCRFFGGLSARLGLIFRALLFKEFFLRYGEYPTERSVKSFGWRSAIGEVNWLRRFHFLDSSPDF